MKKEVDVYRCLICRHEVSSGSARCPFCGAGTEFLVNPAEYFNYDDGLGELTEVETENLIKTLDLEQKNVLFYRELEDRFSDDLELESYFRHARRQEEYHRDEAKSLLGIEDEVEVDALTIPNTTLDVLMKAKEIEEEAISFYTVAKDQTDKIELIGLYDAFIDAENYHIDIFDFLRLLEERR